MKFAYLILTCLISISFVSCDGDDTPTIECDGNLLIHDNELYVSGPKDPSTVINSLSFDAPCLSINLTYGGGCEDHEIDLVIATNVVSPIDTPLEILYTNIIHNNTDLCEALITETRVFDLSIVNELYEQKEFELLVDFDKGGKSLTVRF